MPELPEVETVRRGLDRSILGAEITTVEVTGARSVRRHPPEVLGTVIGEKITALDRFGKFLVLRTGGGADLVVHLRMSGQLRVHSPSDAVALHTHVRFGLGAIELRFIDPRTFGEIFVSEGPDAHGRPVELMGLGPDAFDAPPEPRAFFELLSVAAPR